MSADKSTQYKQNKTTEITPRSLLYEIIKNTNGKLEEIIKEFSEIKTSCELFLIKDITKTKIGFAYAQNKQSAIEYASRDAILKNKIWFKFSLLKLEDDINFTKVFKFNQSKLPDHIKSSQGLNDILKEIRDRKNIKLCNQNVDKNKQINNIQRSNDLNVDKIKQNYIQQTNNYQTSELNKSSLLGHIEHYEKLLPDLFYELSIDDPTILNMLNNIPSDANPKPMLCVLQMKEIQQQTKPDTQMKPSNDPSICHMPTQICRYKWSDNDDFVGIGESSTKKKAEHAAAQKVLMHKFPNNWSFGQLYEYLRLNYDKKRKRNSAFNFNLNAKKEEINQSNNSLSPQTKQEIINNTIQNNSINNLINNIGTNSTNLNKFQNELTSNVCSNYINNNDSMNLNSIQREFSASPNSSKYEQSPINQSNNTNKSTENDYVDYTPQVDNNNNDINKNSTYEYTGHNNQNNHEHNFSVPKCKIKTEITSDAIEKIISRNNQLVDSCKIQITAENDIY